MKSIFYILVFCICATGCSGLGKTKAIGDVVRGMGYSEVQRPTIFFQPGTIVAIKSAMPFEASRVCKSTTALGDSFSPEESPTMSSSWQRATARELKVAGGYKDAINAKLGYKAVKNIIVQLTNTVAYETSDDSVIAAARSGATTDDCKIGITNRFQSNHPMTMISSALQADVLYIIIFEDGISSELKFSLTQQIAPELTANWIVKGEDKVEGKGLIFGIIDDRQLLTSFTSVVGGLPQLAISESVAESKRRLITPNIIVGSSDE